MDVSAGVRYVRAHASQLRRRPRAHRPRRQLELGGQVVLAVALQPGAAAHRHARGPADGSSTAGAATIRWPPSSRSTPWPIRSRYRYVRGREHEPPPPSASIAQRLLASHRAYFADEAEMAAASVTGVIAAGRATARPPAWLAQAELDDNVPAEITEAFVKALPRGRRRAAEHAPFPGARHGFIGQAGPDADKAIALMRDFIGRHLAGSRQPPRAAPAASASRIARHTRSGVTGMSRWRTPSGASASLTAFSSAGSAPTVPASPTPLAPSGLTLVGTSWAVTSKSGERRRRAASRSP